MKKYIVLESGTVGSYPKGTVIYGTPHKTQPFILINASWGWLAYDHKLPTVDEVPEDWKTVYWVDARKLRRISILEELYEETY